jgi:predicted unusual protein kinase regulating ubiquinone biosynthesis (AarF/ABC1/UbiB family)
LVIQRRNTKPETLRFVLEYMGVTWVKLGQALALRFDLLPNDFCRELLKIRPELKPMSYTLVREVIEQELGNTLEKIFTSFQAQPFALTSTGQFHKAEVGTRVVAIKIQSPFLQKQMQIDLSVMHLIARPLDWFRVFDVNSVRELIDDFSRTVAEEIDFRRTAANSQRMSALAADISWERAAGILPQFCTRLVLVSEFIDGINVLQILKDLQRSPEAAVDALTRDNSNALKIARRIYWIALNQIYRDGIFHVDLSPAGLVILPSNVIVQVDFAAIGRLSEELRDSLRYYTQCLLQDQLERAIDELLRWIGPSRSTDLRYFRRDLTRVLEDFLDGFRSPVGSLPREAAFQYLTNVMSVVRHHRASISRGLLSYCKALLTVEAVVLELSPAINLVAEQSRFFDLAAAVDMRDMLRPAHAAYSIIGYYRDARRLLANFKTTLRSSRMIEISLKTLQARLLQYGFWALFIGVCALFGFRDETIQNLQLVLGLGRYWIPSSLMVIVLALLAMMWRQGRRLKVIDLSSDLSHREVSNRSFGQVR